VIFHHRRQKRATPFTSRRRNCTPACHLRCCESAQGHEKARRP
jgi:hypothetical protein